MPVYGTVSDIQTLDVVLYNGNEVISKAEANIKNGEFEANYFALSMIIFLCIEERFHLFKKSTKDDFKNIMYRNLPFNKKEVS